MTVTPIVLIGVAILCLTVAAMFWRIVQLADDDEEDEPMEYEQPESTKETKNGR